MMNIPTPATSAVLLDTNAARYGGTAPAHLAHAGADTLELQMLTAGVVVVQSAKALGSTIAQG